MGLQRAGMTTIAFCELERYSQLVLKKNFPGVPIYDDIRQLDGKQFRGAAQLVCGGFPCQPYSQAGLRQGEADDRDLWPENFRIIQEVQPTWCICENVVGFLKMGLNRALSDLESEGFEVQSFAIPACAVGAYHTRQRIWIVAYSQFNAERSAHGQGITQYANDKQNHGDQFWDDAGNGSEIVAHTNPTGQRERWRAESVSEEQHPSERHSEGKQRGWAVEPRVGRVAYGIPRRVDRLKGLGNAVVPQVVEMIGRAIMEIENQ